MKLVIKGAYYYNRKFNMILVPHFTGEYVTVDCYKFILMDELKNMYDENYIDGVKYSPIEFEGKDYYAAEFGPCHIKDWELLSDLSELSFMEEDYDWAG